MASGLVTSNRPAQARHVVDQDPAEGDAQALELVGVLGRQHLGVEKLLQVIEIGQRLIEMGAVAVPLHEIQRDEPLPGQPGQVCL
jgi:hypothetical protein